LLLVVALRPLAAAQPAISTFNSQDDQRQITKQPMN
jgi:hypothetical protein